MRAFSLAVFDVFGFLSGMMAKFDGTSTAVAIRHNQHSLEDVRVFFFFVQISSLI